MFCDLKGTNEIQYEDLIKTSVSLLKCHTCSYATLILLNVMNQHYQYCYCCCCHCCCCCCSYKCKKSPFSFSVSLEETLFPSPHSLFLLCPCDHDLCCSLSLLGRFTRQLRAVCIWDRNYCYTACQLLKWFSVIGVECTAWGVVCVFLRLVCFVSFEPLKVGKWRDMTLNQMVSSFPEMQIA